MIIYMDNCCFNRVLDDRTYPQIFLDCNSVILVLELIENGYAELYGSEILKFEISETLDNLKRKKLELIYSMCSFEIKITEEIIERAYEIQYKSNIKSKDSLHLACAENKKVDVFLTVDKKFANNAKRLSSTVKVCSPTEWLMEVLYGKDNEN